MSSTPATYAAIAASVIAHLLAFAGLTAVGEPEEPEDDSFAVEIDVAPPPPEALDPPAQPDQPDSEPVTAAAIEPEPKPEPEPEPEIPEIVIDAGVEPVDAAPDASIDAQPLVSGNDAAPDSDAGLVAAADAGPADAGAVAAADSDAGPGLGGDPISAQGPTGVGLDLGFATPAGDHLAVLLRFDRIRGTRWKAPAEAILRPMPDYRMIIGGRKISIIDRLDLLLISSSDPRDVTATNLAGRTVGNGAEVRGFLDHPKSPVTWTPARGGALGMIGSPQFAAAADKRVYLTPLDHWILLADRKHLGALANPSSGDLDAHPPIASLPPWLRKLPRLFPLTGAAASIDDGPAVALSLRGLPEAIDVPMVGRIAPPDHVTAALSIHQLGFVIRGTLEFGTAKEAEAFADTIARTKTSLLSSPMTTAPLRRFHAYHAVNGLTVKRTGARISYATSISVADARAMMKIAAERTAQWYLRTLPNR